MARGWESKTVEADQADSSEGRKRKPAIRPMSAAEEALCRKRDGLRLARSKLLQDLGAARNERYRSMLEEALEQLEKQLEAFQHPGP
jgi:hypothetical protein